MTPSEEAFERFVAALANRGVEAEVTRPDDGNPIARLDVLVHVDAKGRPYSAQGIYLNDVSAALVGADAEGDTIFLQLDCVLPFALSGPDRLAEVGGLLLSLNRLMPLPQFGLSEAEGLIYLRAVITAPSRALPPPMVCEAIDMMQVFLQALSDPIERLASGQATLDEVSTTLHEAGLVVPGLFDMPGPDPD